MHSSTILKEIAAARTDALRGAARRRTRKAVRRQ